eukprot:2995070-Pleurochrysis_carterae.AAC.1
MPASSVGRALSWRTSTPTCANTFRLHVAHLRGLTSRSGRPNCLYVCDFAARYVSICGVVDLSTFTYTFSRHALAPPQARASP